MIRISAIMPTRDRRAFIPLAIASLLSQDWPLPEMELLIIDDGSDPVGELVRELTAGSGIELEYVRMCGSLLEDRQRTIGAKRNLACEMANGDIIVHWDDDDWSAPNRISDQIARLDNCAVTGYHTMLFWEEAKQRASRYENGPRYALGSSLCYRREFWLKHRFPEQNIGEDNTFVNVAAEASTLISVHGRQQMVARVHSGNTSKNKSQFAQVSDTEIPDLFFHHLKTPSDMAAMHT